MSAAGRPPVRVQFGDQRSASVLSRAAATLGQALAARLGAAVRFDVDGDVVAAEGVSGPD